MRCLPGVSLNEQLSDVQHQRPSPLQGTGFESSSQSLPVLSDWEHRAGGEGKEEAVPVNGIPAGLYIKSFQDTQNASFTSQTSHSKQNRLFGWHDSPAEVRDNGIPCLLRPTLVLPMHQQPSCPGQAPWWVNALLGLSPSQPRPREYPGIASWHRPSFLCCFLGKLQWLILYSCSSTVGFFIFSF